MPGSLPPSRAAPQLGREQSLFIYSNRKAPTPKSTHFFLIWMCKSTERQTCTLMTLHSKWICISLIPNSEHMFRGTKKWMVLIHRRHSRASFITNRRTTWHHRKGRRHRIPRGPFRLDAPRVPVWLLVRMNYVSLTAQALHLVTDLTSHSKWNFRKAGTLPC